MSVHSMTGFAHNQVETLLGLLAIDIKSVNSRYQEISLRFPDELRFLEGDIRSALSGSVSRGKIECRMQWVGDTDRESDLNTNTVQMLFNLQNKVTRLYPDAKPLTVSQILSFPGILIPKQVNTEDLKNQVLLALRNTIEVFLNAREREGDALSKVILGYCERIEETVEVLRPRIPQIIQNIHQKLEERLQEALSKTLSENSTLTRDEINDRIRQEVILYAIKLDVDEEINRLLTHIREIRRLLNSGGEVGKKLDFMIQELNREANTLGSKAASIEMTETSLTLKVNIEKIREQIQNLE